MREDEKDSEDEAREGYDQDESHLIPGNFTCPNPDCGAFAHHTLSPLFVNPGVTGAWGGAYQNLLDWSVTQCTACKQLGLWHGKDMVYPGLAAGPVAHPAMPAVVRATYDEARLVSAHSKKSAAALLRLALQQLVDDLVPGGANLNEKIGTLVTEGMSQRLQQAMDVVRVVGNNAVHPGQISLDEQPDLVPALFQLVNLVVEQMISQPEEIRQMFDALPDGPKDAIARRDQPRDQSPS